MLRFLFWRMLGLVSMMLALGVIFWLLAGGPGHVLRGAGPPSRPALSASSVIALARRGLAESTEMGFGLLPTPCSSAADAASAH